MAFWDKLKAELIDIIEWLDPTHDTLVHRFERYNNEIKYGAKLVVRESQAAVFVNEGQIADVFTPGTYTLETKNLPILATLKGWKYGFQSPFKAEVYFVSTRQFTNLKWGTMNPVMLRDAEFGPVRLRAFGTYIMRVKDPATFVKQIAGTSKTFTTAEIADQIRNTIVSRFTDVLGESRIPILDLASNYDELGKFLTDRIAPDLLDLGVELTRMLVENISLPPAVEEALDKRSSMGVIGDLSKFTQYQTAEAMRDAAQNPGGMAAGGMGMGMGFAMANQMGQAMAQQQGVQAGASAAAGGPPPIPGAMSYYLAISGRQAGPFDADGLTQQARSGQLTRDTLVWTAGMANWMPAASVPDLANVINQLPPPIPPQ